MKIDIKKIVINLFTSILPMICAFFGAWAGADGTSKAWRRILIPLLMTSLAYAQTESILTLTVLSMMYGLSRGYGIPGYGDEGSTIGRFFYNLFHQNKFLANIFTRGTIALLIGLSFLSLPIIKGNWLIFLLGVCGMILVNALISWRDFKGYILFGKFLSWSETLTWGLISLCGVLIIKL